MTRATFAAAAKYRALSHTAKDPAAADAVDRQLGAPVRELFSRGRADGTLRADLAAETLFELYVGLLQGALDRRLADTLGVEQAGAAVVTVFLSGAGSGPAAAR
ncbi:hypothetical protein [Jiangella alkaliphila]|uniref:hypothetical protein n=1 Tax=Jiangella alkaliphila TaxID=419479 RepID=UPI00069A782B|nr:hypothetical protein [Jiangella alkaliphila]